MRRRLNVAAGTRAIVYPTAKPLLRIDAFNPSERLLKDTAFVVQALEADGQIVSQWRLKFPGEISAKAWVKDWIPPLLAA